MGGGREGREDARASAPAPALTASPAAAAAQNACEHLSGYSVGNRYLIVTYHQPAKAQKAQDARKKEMEVEALRKMAEEVEGR